MTILPATPLPLTLRVGRLTVILGWGGVACPGRTAVTHETGVITRELRSTVAPEIAGVVVFFAAFLLRLVAVEVILGC